MARRAKQQSKWAPVAEYRGVAILERSGSRRAVWKGQEYRTDGRFYIWLLKSSGDLRFFGLPSERDAKDLIDALPGGGLPGRECFVGLRQAYRLCRCPAWLLAHYDQEAPDWQWDDHAGHFYNAKERSVDFESAPDTFPSGDPP